MVAQVPTHRVRRRELIAGIGVGAALWPPAQEPPKHQNAERRCGPLCGIPLMNIARIVGVDEHGHSSEARHRGLEQFQALRRGLLGQSGKAGNIAAGMRETRNKAKCHRVRDGEGGLHRIGGGGVDPFQFDAIPQKQVEGLFAADDPIFYEIADKVARLALELRLPGIFQSRRCRCGCADELRRRS